MRCQLRKYLAQEEESQQRWLAPALDLSGAGRAYSFCPTNHTKGHNPRQGSVLDWLRSGTNALFVRIYDRIKTERPWPILGTVLKKSVPLFGSNCQKVYDTRSCRARAPWHKAIIPRSELGHRHVGALISTGIFGPLTWSPSSRKYAIYYANGLARRLVICTLINSNLWYCPWIGDINSNIKRCVCERI